MRLALCLLTTVLTLSFTMSAAGQDINFDGDPYVAGRIGFNQRENSSSTRLKQAGFSNSIRFDTDYNTSIALGYYPEDLPVRPELELGYLTSDVDNIRTLGITRPSSVLRGDLSSINLMANLYYDHPLTDNLDGYLGAGAGMARMTADFQGSGLLNFEDDSDTVLAYQFMAGLAWHYEEDIVFDFGYRYSHSGDPEFSFGEIEGSATHIFELGVRYKF
jgi:opacity protein-like surface antigen